METPKCLVPCIPSAIRRAAKLLAGGGLVAFPTETVYGLGANALNPRAVKNIFKAKGRPSDNPLIVHIATMKELESVADQVPEAARRLMKKFWPGPLTFVLPKKKIVPSVVTAGGPTVAVRMPKHPVALALIKAAGCPVAAPSANLAGRPSPTTATHVAHDLGDKIDCILDGGKTRHGLESTVIDFRNGIVEILRSGAVTAEMMAKVLGYTPKMVRHTKGKVRSPGMKYRHYAPGVSMILFTAANEKKLIRAIRIEIPRLQQKKIRIGVLCVREHSKHYSMADKTVICGSLKNPQLFAKNLYASLRKFHTKDVDIILAENIGKEGIAHAAFDRLSRAATRSV